MTVVSPCTQNLMDSAHPQTVLSKLNEQRSQGLFCDVTIVVEDVKFRAHKNILAACSGYFRNALTTPETWSSNQVLELMDLKSEVFASILNFIYCSKVTPPGAVDTGGLVAAGKRLGIPFLEKLSEQERQDECVKPTDYSSATVCKKTKKEAPRPEDTDSATGPRITNAFSINEVCPGNNLFTPLVQTNGERQSPDVGQLPSSVPTTSCVNSETTQALSEHSYAVSKSTDSKDSSQWDNKTIYKPAISQPKQLIYRNTGPLKKRHRLRCTVVRSLLPTPAEPQTEKPNTLTPRLADGASTVPDTVATPPPLFSESEKSIDPGPDVAADNSQIDLGPPPLSPHTEDSISIYGCEHCPEIFTNKALLTIHSELHKKRFVSHLFCKFCHRKFIHLKRLRNHEQVCPKAARTPPKLQATDTSTKELDLLSDDMPNIESIEGPVPSADSPTPETPETLQLDQSEPPEKAVRPGGGQRRYNCSVCKRVYVTLSSLKRHENVHSWQRAYPCHYCNKVFALAEYRTKHEIWHTGERRYQCIFCLETFMTYYILKNHQKSFHGIDPSLAVKKKSANGGLKASVYPIKLYRLLPMKFRKRRYKTYSQTYSESLEKGDESPPESSSLIPPFEENGVMSNPDAISFPVTFMATTKMVAPVMPRISFDKPCDQGVEQGPNGELDIQKGTRKDTEAFMNTDNTFSLQPSTDPHGLGDKSELLGQNVPFFNSLNTVKKLGELSASARKVEEMTKEILQSSSENLVRDKAMGTKIETYIAKPVCPGPSVDGSAMPLCQITVKIGNEAIIRRRIKGSKLFPKKKRRIRELNEDDSSGQSQIRENSESPRLRLRPEATAATGRETYDDPNDLDTADMLWRPYYSYKAKKKRKKLRFKHRNALFQCYPETSVDRSAVSEDRSGRPTEESVSGSSGEMKRSLSRNSSPRATYNCDICDSSFITETGLRAHVIGSHPCFCRTCGKQGPPGEVPAGGDYICNSCMENGSCFDNSPRSPNPEKKYRCSFCPQRFLYLATKRSHEKKHQETNEEGYSFDESTPCSKYKSENYKEDNIKTEEGDYEESPDIKSERVEGGHFSGDKFKPKIEDATDYVSLTAYQDMSFSNFKSPLSPSIDPVFALTPSKVKHKMQKRKISAQHPMHVISKKQAYDREGSKDVLTGLKKNNPKNEKSCKLFRTNDSETKAAHISIHKPEKWVCKEEPFF
ncbi:zinc finger and BTB domain-containing protein 38 [Notolabrus celidotus]|uniref:zinc finger and BTB domain-containing protein 38 n=1 Tax=Notolabrus celidotus TaxID=1203425 RepID=UPI00148F8AD1|nr:zinc finger and BTB domain-containing protein 38 [Notolabrus celidotus]XP_034556436.1 zinc finger and BTB domain-containing protein 38 [Notolabrus celidotus]XP_034556437.1 zinc finger and BTB domain-containing protein 38 [Notolabrus celidotus]XP_034556438.1 zinc finger and BTB domain-containing protein 38 [Notolabrus celidotus]